MTVPVAEFDDPGEMTLVDMLAVRPYTPPGPKVDPLADAEFPVTEPAVMARSVPCQRVLRLECGGPGRAGTLCTVAFGHGSTRSFAALYGWAWLDGWRQDAFGRWTCPACQMLPTWRTRLGLSPLGRTAEDAGADEARIIEATRAEAGTPDQFVEALKAVA